MSSRVRVNVKGQRRPQTADERMRKVQARQQKARLEFIHKYRGTAEKVWEYKRRVEEKRIEGGKKIQDDRCRTAERDRKVGQVKVKRDQELREKILSRNARILQKRMKEEKQQEEEDKKIVKEAQRRDEGRREKEKREREKSQKMREYILSRNARILQDRMKEEKQWGEKYMKTVEDTQRRDENLREIEKGEREEQKMMEIVPSRKWQRSVEGQRAQQVMQRRKVREEQKRDEERREKERKEREEEQKRLENTKVYNTRMQQRKEEKEKQQQKVDMKRGEEIWIREENRKEEERKKIENTRAIYAKVRKEAEVLRKYCLRHHPY